MTALPQRLRLPPTTQWVAATTTLLMIAAATASDGVTMTWSASADSSTPITFDLADAGSWAELESGVRVYTGSLFQPQWQLGWTATVDPGPDPVFDLLLSVTNTSAGVQVFGSETIVEPWFDVPDQSMLTTAAALTVMNLQFSGSASIETTEDTPLVAVALGENDRATLFAPVYGLTAFGPFSTATDAAMTSVLTGGGTSWTSAAAFSLSAGDTATIHISSNLSAIPSPSALPILATLVGLPHRRRGGLLSRSRYT